MRALKKIIFVNSAHIRYAEVRLDGNVHFIGTQGVGKSTLLRAILFFYNADKQHLGIPKEMKSFDEFYLPHANSYIVYEVEHEHGPFSILVFRSSGRACYRFVDAAFSKDWLVDDRGEVTAEIKVIRERLEGAHISRIVDRYEQYKDIIYGNNVSKEFARFQLMESSRYQNIPRSIQNVFLNSRLDADFIKDIIIRSMNEEEANIDLGYFRRQVADFESEYKDISCWYRTNGKGEYPVRKQADLVVKSYHNLLYMKKHISELCGQLNYSVRVSRERLPLIEADIQDKVVEKERQERLSGEVKQKFDQEKSSLNQEQGVVNDALKRLKERREFYILRKIDEILNRSAKENQLGQELEALKYKRAELTAKYNDVTSRFKALVQAEKAGLESFLQSQKAREQELREKKLQAEGRMMEELYSRKRQVDESFGEALAMAGEKVESIRKERENCEKELLKLNLSEPFKEKIKAVSMQQNQLDLRDKELLGLINACNSDISRLEAVYDKDEASIEAEYERLLSSKLREEAAVKEKIEDIETLIERSKGSLLEWLENNKPDWGQNIGKVINEENVLYQTGLHPQKVDGNSFYGVQLDLIDLPQKVRKPEELFLQKGKLVEELKTLEAEYDALLEEKAVEEDVLKKSFSAKIKELRQTQSQYEAEYNMIPQRRKLLTVKVEDFQTKAKKWISSRKEELTLCQQDIAHRMTEAEAERKKVEENRNKQLKQVEKANSEEKEKVGAKYRQGVSEIEKESVARKKASEEDMLRLNRQELDELKGRGADTAMVDRCNSQIKTVEAELEYIRQNRKLVFDYQKDKEELFDNEDKFKAQKKALADKLQNLSEKYELRRAGYDRVIAELAGKLAERYGEKKFIEDNLRRFDSFSNDENLCPVGLADEKERNTIDSPGKIIDELTSVIVNKQRGRDRLKENINMFKGNFTANNTFSFPKSLISEDDYYDFASNLDDFLINNKLEEYRRRTSERYVDILARVSKEMGDLTRHESDVEKIILDINNDFRERNFVGVIKRIELKSVASSDRMVQLMKRIKDFNDDNDFAMGEINLFSSSDREKLNEDAVEYLLQFMTALQEDVQRQYLTLSDLFQLQFRIVENDNDTGWADKLSHVGSEGTDTLVKAMINIMLINVFKEKVSRRFGDFRLHCMMDEIGKLHPQNVKGILDFANARNILLINSSPTTYNVSDYRYTYLLSKDGKSRTVVQPLISQQ